jgi:hypothetical protein
MNRRNKEEGLHAKSCKLRAKSIKLKAESIKLKAGNGSQSLHCYILQGKFNIRHLFTFSFLILHFLLPVASGHDQNQPA